MEIKNVITYEDFCKWVESCPQEKKEIEWEDDEIPF